MALGVSSSQAVVPETRLVESLAVLDSFVAVGLSDGSIEFLDRTYFNVLGFIPGSPERSVRRLCGLGDRLFSAGVHGGISEWDVSRRKLLDSSDSGNGAVWDLKLLASANRSIFPFPVLLAACDSGSVVVFEVREFSFREISVLRGPKRCLAVCAVGNFLISGHSTGGVSRHRVLGQSVSGGRNFQVQCDASADLAGGALVWSLEQVDDRKFLSGDSLGNISLWDAELFVRLRNFQVHQGDLLCMRVFGLCVFTGGVDGRVVQLSLARGEEEISSIDQTNTLEIFQRDVCALATLSDGTLLFGGADGRVGKYKEISGAFAPEKFPIMHNCVVTSDAANSLHAVIGASDAGGALVVATRPSGNVILAEISVHLSLAQISPSGKYVVVSGPEGSKVLQLEISSLKIQKVQETRREFRHVLFDAQDERTAHVVTAQGKLLSWKFLEHGLDEAETVNLPPMEGQVSALVAGVQEQSLLLGTTAGELAMIDLKNSAFKCTRVKNASKGGRGVPVVALAVEDAQVYVLGGNGNFWTFETSELKLAGHRNLRKLANMNSRDARNLKFLRVRAGKVFLASETKLISDWKVVDTLDAGLGLVYGLSTSRVSELPQDAKRPRPLAPQQPCLLFTVDPAEISARLPPPFARKRFH